MAQKSGFFNARLINGEYDRKYSADDYSDNLAVVIGNGVLRSTDNDLKVTASGMLLTVGVGRAWINGHYYHNTTPMTLAPVPVAAGGSRYDRVILRMDKTLQERNVQVLYMVGTASNDPQKPALVRNDNVYDICLADIYVPSGGNYVIAYDTRDDKDVCGWVYSTSGDDSFFTSLDYEFYTWFNEVRDEVATVTILKRYTRIVAVLRGRPGRLDRKGPRRQRGRVVLDALRCASAVCLARRASEHNMAAAHIWGFYYHHAGRTTHTATPEDLSLEGA